MPTPTRLGYRPSLDVIRAGAVLAVMACHTELPGFSQGGFVGVEVFFVLSGFLITTLLIGDRSLGGFYARRARRLLPALAVLLAVVSVVALAFGDTDTLTGAVLACFYSANIARAAGWDLGAVGHLWSLSVEEQFYICWPIIVLIARTPQRVLAIAVALVVSLFCWRWNLVMDGIFYSTATRATGLLAGAALGALFHLRPISLPRWTGYAAAAALTVMTVTNGPVFDYLYRWGLPFIDVCTLVMICGFLTVERAPNPLVRVGVLSYGLYLWHYPIVYALGTSVLATVVVFAGSFLLAEGSMRFVEQRWRKPVAQSWPHLAVR